MRYIATAILVGMITGNSVADEPVAKDVPKETDEKPTSFWMEKKMEYSQAILRGLATADFESISENSAQLGLLNRVEGFVRRKNPDYRTHLHTFQRIVDDLFKQAGKENLEGTTLAFTELTVSCVKCHQSLRSEPNGNLGAKRAQQLKPTSE